MRAKFHGMEVEGTPEEILKIKDEMDRREEVKHNFKFTIHSHTVKDATAFGEEIIKYLNKDIKISR